MQDVAITVLLCCVAVIFLMITICLVVFFGKYILNLIFESVSETEEFKSSISTIKGIGNSSDKEIEELLRKARFSEYLDDGIQKGYSRLYDIMREYNTIKEYYRNRDRGEW